VHDQVAPVVYVQDGHGQVGDELVAALDIAAAAKIAADGPDRGLTVPVLSRIDTWAESVL